MTTGTQRLIVGVFDDAARARRAVVALREAGFSETKIGLAVRTSEGSTDTVVDRDEAENIEAGAITGAVGGAGIGGLWAIGVAVGFLPAIGPVVVGGLLASILASAAGAAAVGGVVGALVGMGLSEEDARLYEDELRAGNSLVTVHANGRSADAENILLDHGAQIRS